MSESYSFLQHRDDDVAQVNMTPLIDVILFLLFFFVLTTNFNRLAGVEVNKPKAQTAKTQGASVMIIGVTREGGIHVYGRQITLDRLRALVENEVTRRPDLSVVIVAVRQASIGRTVEVLDQCNLGGARKVSVAADRQ